MHQKLDDEEQKMLDSVKDMFDKAVEEAYKRGYLDGVGKRLEEDDVSMHRFVMHKYTLLGGVIAIIGSILSIGIFIGRNV
jgi:hypothetical protein